jgi:hypothetical protein
MNGLARSVVAIFATFCSLWDAYTTFQGMTEFIGQKAVALFFTIVVNGAIFLAFADLKNEIVRSILTIIVVAATACDLYTAYTGNISLMRSEDVEKSSHIFICGVMTTITVGSSFLISFLLFGEQTKRAAR